MPDWQKILGDVRGRLGRVPKLAWVAGGVIAASLGFALYLEMGGPPYVALYDGLAPADGGKVIAQLQKLGIPYQLQAAGNVILVPASQLAAARLQLGAAAVPGGTAANGWDKLENAPMTTSDLAQSAMATQALETSLEQSIESLAGVTSAQVYLALPQDTPFLADQPKPTASVVIAADEADANIEGAAIANLVAGAVPGLQAEHVSVQTTSGVKVFPTSSQATVSSQFAIVRNVETEATSRVATLLIPLVGSGHFRIGVSADLDFTREHIHQIAYGPNQLVSHQDRSQSVQIGNTSSAIGIPGALSNEPPSAHDRGHPVDHDHGRRRSGPCGSREWCGGRRGGEPGPQMARPAGARQRARPLARVPGRAAAAPRRPASRSGPTPHRAKAMSPTRARATSRSPTGRSIRLPFPSFWTGAHCAAPRSIK